MVIIKRLVSFTYFSDSRHFSLRDYDNRGNLTMDYLSMHENKPEGKRKKHRNSHFFTSFLMILSGRVWGTKFRMVKCYNDRYSRITNIKITKDVLFDYFIYVFFLYYYYFKKIENSKYLIIFPNYKIF